MKTHNNSHGKRIERRNVTRVDSTDSGSKCPPKFNSGPPCLMGEDLLCEANGLVLHWAFVLEADHPRYCLWLHNGQEIDMGVTPLGLMPQYAPG